MSEKVQPTRGMRDFLPADKQHREYVLRILREVFTSHGFFEIETPVMEPITRLKSGQGGENESMLFEVLRRGLPADTPVSPTEAVDLGMRYDLTLPLSRYYASNQGELPAVFRAFQTGPVWRAERPQKGRFRQFNQCDIDILGAPGWTAEVEVLSLAWTAMEKLSLADEAVVLINHRQLLTALLEAVQISEENYSATLIALDKLDKIGGEGVIAELVDREICAQESAEKLLAVVTEIAAFDLSANPEATEVESKILGQGLPLFELAAITSALKKIKPSVKCQFTPSLVRGMGYYTGPIFEVSHTRFNSSICGGGRYDGVIGRWTAKPVPAVGFSFGFERIIDLIPRASEQTALCLGLAYQKDHEALAALSFLHALDQLPQSPLGRVGLIKAPRKINNNFFAEAASLGYQQVLLPSAYLELETDPLDQYKLAQVLEQAKTVNN